MQNRDTLHLLHSKSEFADYFELEHPAASAMRHWFKDDSKFIDFMVSMSESGLLINPKHIGELLLNYRLATKLRASRLAFESGNIEKGGTLERQMYLMGGIKNPETKGARTLMKRARGVLARVYVASRRVRQEREEQKRAKAERPFIGPDDLKALSYTRQVYRELS